MTPHEFIEMYTELMNHGLPSENCQRVSCLNQKTDRDIVYGLKDRAKLYAMSISNLIVINMGHTGTIKFLASQIAALSLHLAWKAVISDQANS